MGRVVSLLLFCVAFAFTGIMVTAWDRAQNRPVPIPLLQQKWLEIAQQDAAIDTLFIGSSQIFRSIDAAALDTELRRRGCTSRSYNLGIPSLTIAEMLDLLVRLREGRSHKFRRVVIEMPPPAAIDPDNLLTPRIRHYMSAGNLGLILQDIWSSSDGFLRRAKHSIFALGAFAVEWSGTGKLAAVLFPEKNAITPGVTATLALEQGYLSLEADASAGIAERGVHFQQHRGEYAQIFKAAVTPSPGPKTIPQQRWNLIQNLLRNAAPLSDEIFFLVSPKPQRARIGEAAALEQDWRAQQGISEHIAPVTLLNMNHPQRYPALFQIEQWFDGGHLSESGVGLFTTLLAAQLCPRNPA